MFTVRTARRSPVPTLRLRACAPALLDAAIDALQPVLSLPPGQRISGLASPAHDLGGSSGRTLLYGGIEEVRHTQQRGTRTS